MRFISALRLLILVMLLFFSGKAELYAQEVDEITLTFAYPSIGQVYVNAAFRAEQPLIGLTELLHLLFIPYERMPNGMGLRGSYPGKGDVWEIDPVAMQLLIKGQKNLLEARQIYLGETDLFVVPELFEQIFGFRLVVNPYGLVLSLESTRPLPVDERAKRQLLREKLKEQAPEDLLRTYPMMYPRQRAALAAGMLDYNFGVNAVNGGALQYNYAFNMGMEVLGGDIQAGFSGLSSSLSQQQRLSGARWRYVFKDGMRETGNPAISELQIGQLNMQGPIGGRLRGISLSNTPIIPRRVLDIYVVEGNTDPDSEVELLVAGQMVDFVRADELGYYRFNVPISYGTVRVGIRIYTPSGEVIVEDKQLQIPFTFLPKGFTDYNLQMGLEEFGLGDSIGNTLVGHANVAHGLTNNITLRSGVTRSNDTLLTAGLVPYGSVSFRMFDQYLFNLDVLPNTFNRLNGSVFYANNTAINMQYTEYARPQLGDDRRMVLLRDASLNYFFPFTIAKRSYALRTGIEQLWLLGEQRRRLQLDANVRLGPIVTRLNYREEQVRRLEQASYAQRLFTATFTYMVPRTPGIPVFMRGMFFRGQLRHDGKTFDANAFASLQFSQTVWKIGRLNLSYDRDVLRKANLFNVGLLLDFQAIRSSSQALVVYQNRQLNVNTQQQFTGSVGADLKNGRIMPTNRDQIGRAGVVIRLFIDENNNSKYDKGEPLVGANCIRLDQSATMVLGSDSLLRITQLQSYWKYRLTVDVNALPDATLTPLNAKMTFVADPNRYKSIDIPLYRTGAIDGMVYTQRSTSLEPQSGLRLFVQRQGSEEEPQLIRSLSDGGFYAFGLIPGDYTLLADSGQLAFMRMVQQPDTLKFTIKSLAEGDWIEGLELTLVPKEQLPNESLWKTEADWKALLAGQLGDAVKLFTEAQELVYRGLIKEAEERINQSLNIYETTYGLALKGTITYLLGRREEARIYWIKAQALNPEIIIPERNMLDKLTIPLTSKN